MSTPKVKVESGSLATHFTGSAKSILNETCATYQLNWTGSPSGTLRIEHCLDAEFKPDGTYVTGSGNWATVTSGVISGTFTGPLIINAADLSTAFIRPVFSASAGSGTGSLYFMAKKV